MLSLVEMRVSMVISLNMMNVARDRELDLDTDKRSSDRAICREVHQPKPNDPNNATPNFESTKTLKPLNSPLDWRE